MLRRHSIKQLSYELKVWNTTIYYCPVGVHDEGMTTASPLPVTLPGSCYTDPHSPRLSLCTPSPTLALRNPKLSCYTALPPPDPYSTQVAPLPVAPLINGD